MASKDKQERTERRVTVEAERDVEVERERMDRDGR